MVGVVVATLILFWLLGWAVIATVDVWRHCRVETDAAEHEALLEKLWDDGPPRAVNREAVQTSGGAEAS